MINLSKTAKEFQDALIGRSVADRFAARRLPSGWQDAAEDAIGDVLGEFTRKFQNIRFKRSLTPLGRRIDGVSDGVTWTDPAETFTVDVSYTIESDSDGESVYTTTSWDVTIEPQWELGDAPDIDISSRDDASDVAKELVSGLKRLKASVEKGREAWLNEYPDPDSYEHKVPDQMLAGLKMWGV